MTIGTGLGNARFSNRCAGASRSIIGPDGVARRFEILIETEVPERDPYCRSKSSDHDLGGNFEMLPATTAAEAFPIRGFSRISPRMTFNDLLSLTRITDTAWTSPGVPRTDEPRLFGGVLIAQAILAASADAPACHALHAFFIGVGEKQSAFDIAVTRTRDGRSFATRQFEISQANRLLLAGHSSHHNGDAGPAHQADMPDVPPPESLEEQRVLRARRAEAAGRPARTYLLDVMLDVRPAELPQTGAHPERAVWFRPRAAFRGDAAMHRAVIGFASDVGLVQVGLLHHGRNENPAVQAASLDHSIWFHGEAAADDWLLHVQRSPVLGRGRGFSLGTIFSRDGRLVASVAQEFLARTRK